jgi:pimeloyl-ACP methyl ester carboxylesterase
MRPTTSKPTALFALVILVLAPACRKAEPPSTGLRVEPTASPSVAPKPIAAAAPVPRAPAKLEHLRVPGDARAVVVRADDGRPPTTVFLPGICSNAEGYLAAFPEAARAQGGVVAIDGDVPCQGAPGFHSWSWDAEHQGARIEAALAAAGLREIPPEGITLVGYSAGATIAEKLSASHPSRFSRAFVLGAPTDVSVPSFQRSRAVVTGACSLDVTARMRQGSTRLAAKHVPSTYVEMPGCAHGQVADAEAVFDQAFAFLRTNALPVPEGAAPVPIVGYEP